MYDYKKVFQLDTETNIVWTDSQLPSLELSSKRVKYEYVPLASSLSTDIPDDKLKSCNH